MSYDWHALKAAHNGMISIQNRIRLFYFISQAYISSYQNITKKLDEVAFSGTSAIEADAQIFEKRVGKQVELLAQINAKTAQFAEVNNQYYKQKTASITASDVGVRIAKGVKLYGDLAAAAVYLASVVAHAIAKANAAAPWYPVAYAIAEGLKLTASGLQIAAMVGEVTEKSIYVAHQYGIPRMMEEDLYAENLNDTSTAKALEIFKKMTYYKSPITLENGDKWVSSYNDFPDSITESDAIAFLKDIYDNYSPVVETNDFTYKSEGLMRDEWQTVDETVQSKSGDCEDYAILAASRAVFTKNGVRLFLRLI